MKKITKLKPNQIFVFGSNGNGSHAGGAALQALKFGAVMGQARGLQGQSYAIETLNKKMQKVSLTSLKRQFKELWECARQNPDKEFLLTKVGCGIAGFNELEVRDCFNSEDVPSNVVLPEDWVYKRLWKSLPKDMAPRGHKFEVGKWYFQEGKIAACRNGFHASQRVMDAMSYVDCEVLALVEVRGDVATEDGKQASQQMRLIEAHKWTKEQSVKLAVFAAELVIEVFEKEHPNDKRPREAIEAAKAWLANPTLAARNASGDAWAAGAAAGAAAWAAAGAAGDAWAAGAAWNASGDAGDAWAAGAAEAAAWAARNASGDAVDAAGAAARAAGAAAGAAAWAAAGAAAGAAAWAARDALLDKIEKYIQTELLTDFTNKK